MLTCSYLRKLVAALFSHLGGTPARSPLSSRRPRRPAHRFRPLLEALELRLTPSPATFTEGTANNPIGDGVGSHGTLLTIDGSVAASAITYTLTTFPAVGYLKVNGVRARTFTQADINAGNVTYTNDASKSDQPTDSFGYSVQDTNGPLGTGTFTINLLEGAATVAINIPAVVAVGSTSSTVIGTGTDGTLLSLGDGIGTPPAHATIPSDGSGPDGLAFDSSGNLYIANYFSSTIIKVTPAGAASTFITGNPITGPKGLAFDSSGNLFVANFNANTILKYSPEGGAAHVHRVACAQRCSRPDEDRRE